MNGQLRKWGNSLAVRIPKPVAEAAKLREGDPLEFKVNGARVIEIRAAQTKPTLEQLIQGITPENRHGEQDWGRPVGRELW
jgi:antitoxin MazE